MGYDMAQPADHAGDQCPKCRGSGVYAWGPVVNGKVTHTGQCHSCAGKGFQTLSDIRRGETYNRHKIINLGAN
jgi:DnaJ-class molecular chaperone